MSTEPSEGETPTANTQADITEQVTTTQADITQQATTPTPTTHVKKIPNPKRVAAGKRTAEKTRLAWEKQKKNSDAYLEMQNNNEKATTAAPAPEVESPKNSGLSINQWIGVGGLHVAVSLAGIYYKREELKAAFKKNPPEPTPSSVEPEPARAPQRKKGVRHMD